MAENSRIAIFIDAENVADWLKHGGIELLLPELNTLGQIIIRRAYGVWSNSQLISHQARLNQQGFELVHCYHPAAGKNSADIQMTVDVMECAWQIENITTFVLVTGDSDFSPLFRRLREMGKKVIGVGRNSTLSECVKTSCSQFIYTDKFLAEKKNKEVIELEKPKKDNKILDKVVLLIHQILKQEKEPLDISELKEQLILLNPVFHQQKLEFKSWVDFLNTIEGIELTQKGCLWFAQDIFTKKLLQEQPKKDNQQLTHAIQLIHKILKEEKEPLNISMLRIRLVALDASFDHKKLVFKRWIDFLQSIKEITLEKQGSAWFAKNISTKKSKNKKKANLEELYKNILLPNKKRQISHEKLKIIYKQTVLLGNIFNNLALIKSTTLEALQKKNYPINNGDIHNSFHIFVLAELLEKKEKGIKIKEMSTNDFLLAIDRYFIKQLVFSCKRNKVELKVSEIKKITHSTISKNEIKSLIEK